MHVTVAEGDEPETDPHVAPDTLPTVLNVPVTENDVDDPEIVPTQEPMAIVVGRASSALILAIPLAVTSNAMRGIVVVVVEAGVVVEEVVVVSSTVVSVTAVSSVTQSSDVALGDAANANSSTGTTATTDRRCAERRAKPITSRPAARMRNTPTRIVSEEPVSGRSHVLSRSIGESYAHEVRRSE